MAATRSDTAAFAMPLRCTGAPYEVPLLRKVLSAILQQSDDHWLLVVVDDCSPCSEAGSCLREYASRYPEKIVMISMPDHRGPGRCRNVAIHTISEHGIPIIMFNDSDDVPHRQRVEVTRKAFSKQSVPTVLYSSFIPVDEAGTSLRATQLTPSLSEILQAHRDGPPEGSDVWRDIGTQKGYVSLCSATSVSTALAVEQPFPHEMVSEDSHTWMRYSAAGGVFVYDNRIPVKYRVTTDRFGSASRTRHGDTFYTEKARVDEAGFKSSIEIALQRGTIKEAETAGLLVGFYIRLSETMIREEAFATADSLVRKAFEVSQKVTRQAIEKNSVVLEYYRSKLGGRSLE